MVTLTEFVVELFGSLLELGRLLLTDVAFNDPLSFVSFVTGAILLGFSMLFFAYLALGAFGDLFTSDSSGRRRRQRG